MVTKLGWKYLVDKCTPGIWLLCQFFSFWLANSWPMMIDPLAMRMEAVEIGFVFNDQFWVSGVCSSGHCAAWWYCRQRATALSVFVHPWLNARFLQPAVGHSVFRWAFQRNLSPKGSLVRKKRSDRPLFQPGSDRCGPVLRLLWLKNRRDSGKVAAGCERWKSC